MRRLAVLPLLAVLALAGCTGGEAEPEPTPTETADVQAIGQQAFVETIHAEYAQSDRYTDEQWLTLADSTCDALTTGNTPAEIEEAVTSAGLDHEGATHLIIGSATTICPEHSDIVLQGW